MSNILLIQSSIFGERSRSLGLAREFLNRHYPGQPVTERVLTRHRCRISTERPLPLLQLLRLSGAIAKSNLSRFLIP